MSRARAWLRAHPRAAGAAALTGGLILVGVAGGLGWLLLVNRPEVGLAPSASASAEATESADPTPSATMSPAASAETSVDPVPSPTVMPGLTWPPVGTDPGPSSGAYRLWATATVDALNVRSGPGPEHPVVGQLHAGDLVLAPYGLAGPGQFTGIVGDGVAGYVSGGPADGPYLLATRAPWTAHQTEITGVASNGRSYIAYGPRGVADYLFFAGDTTSLMLVSDDGETWTESEPPGRVYSVVGGPGGWLAFFSIHGGVSFTSFSPDGRTWEEPVVGAGYAAAYGPAGWLRTQGENHVARSLDGRTWDDPTPVWGGDTTLTDLAASDTWYVAWWRLAGRAWASVDGSSWITLNIPDGVAVIEDIDLRGDRLVLLTSDQVGGSSRIWSGTLSASGVSWDSSGPTSVGGSAAWVYRVGAGADGFLALGWDAGSLAPAAWSSVDGSRWAAASLNADALGGSVLGAPAWGAGGWVALGSATEGAGIARQTAVRRTGWAIDGAARQVWRSGDGTAWAPTGARAAYDGPRPPCPPVPEVTTLVLLYLGAFASDCFGDTSLTVRAYVPEYDVHAEFQWPDPEPSWLAGPYAADYVVAAEPMSMDEPVLALALPPGVDGSALRAGAWVEIVGHFDDPAASTCRWTPNLVAAAGGPGAGLEAPAVARADCASRFVVDSVVAVGAP